MDLETLWYEAFPYLYGLGGVVAILVPAGSGLLKGSGTLLIAAALIILRVRQVYRRQAFARVPAAADLAERHSPDD